MSFYVLDTNTVSNFVRGHSAVRRRMKPLPMASLHVSAPTEGELVFGLEKRPVSRQLYDALKRILDRIDVMPWDRAAAQRYGALRATLQRGGKGLGDMDLLIAAHVLSVGGIMVTSDKAFRGVPDLVVEDWAVS